MEKSSGSQINVETKTALLKGYCHSGQMQKAMVLFETMCTAKGELMLLCGILNLRHFTICLTWNFLEHANQANVTDLTLERSTPFFEVVSGQLQPSIWTKVLLAASSVAKRRGFFFVTKRKI